MTGGGLPVLSLHAKAPQARVYDDRAAVQLCLILPPEEVKFITFSSSTPVTERTLLVEISQVSTLLKADNCRRE